MSEAKPAQDLWATILENASSSSTSRSVASATLIVIGMTRDLFVRALILDVFGPFSPRCFSEITPDISSSCHCNITIFISIAARDTYLLRPLMLSGNEGSGKTTLISRLKREKPVDTIRGTGLEYTYLDVREEDSDGIVYP
jgi:hypothetical protein